MENVYLNLFYVKKRSHSSSQLHLRVYSMHNSVQRSHHEICHVFFVLGHISRRYIRRPKPRLSCLLSQLRSLHRSTHRALEMEHGIADKLSRAKRLLGVVLQQPQSALGMTLNVLYVDSSTRVLVNVQWEGNTWWSRKS